MWIIETVIIKDIIRLKLECHSRSLLGTQEQKVSRRPDPRASEPLNKMSSPHQAQVLVLNNSCGLKAIIRL